MICDGDNSLCKNQKKKLEQNLFSVYNKSIKMRFVDDDGKIK